MKTKLKIRQLKNRLLKEERRRRTNSPRRRRLRRALLLGLLLLTALAVFCWNQRDAINLYRYHQAETLARQGDYGAAVNDLQQLAAAVSDSPLAPRSLLLAGQLLEFNLRQYQQALLVYLRLVRDFPRAQQAVAAQRRAAAIYKQRLHEYSSALTLLQRLVDAGVDDADQIRYQIADCYFLLENYEQARIEFESLLKSDPESELLPEVQYRVGMTYLLDELPDKAAAAFAEGIRRWPGNRFALESRFALAGIYEQRDELRKALAELKKLQGHYPEAKVLEHRIKQVRRRMAKKKKAI
ncbi:hypothetical protein B5V00_12350 [Geothermobacter hydrogeniphilus]|uniref:Uncharacterized protein n=1 Tax=Geothermobacter hydrogeniphilus TaxID=1969733 RepID=A0A1X0XZH7_9BACT|nr:hypothetical protein B5V00_12350 [Geothermobacter hydrogeniphilus]